MNHASNENVQVYWAVGKDMADLLNQAAITVAALKPIHVDVSTDYDCSLEEYTVTLYIT